MSTTRSGRREERSPKKNRRCAECHMLRGDMPSTSGHKTQNVIRYKNCGPDPCLGLLENVAHACCGHGVKGMAYVVHGEGLVGGESCVAMAEEGIPHELLKGSAALKWFKERGVGPVAS